MSEPNLESSIFVHLSDASAGLVFYDARNPHAPHPERVMRRFCPRCLAGTCTEPMRTMAEWEHEYGISPVASAEQR